VTLRERAIAARDRDREHLTGIGVTAGGSIGLRVRVAAIRAFRQYRDPQAVADAVRGLVDLTVPIVAQSMSAAYLTGIRRSHTEAARAAGVRSVDELRLDLAPYSSALNFLQGRLDLSNDALASLTRAFGDEAVNVTRNFSAAVEDKVANAVRESIAAGEHVGAGVARMRAAFEAAGVTNQKSYAIETLFRTQNSLAYSAGQSHANSDPAIDEILWGYEYATVEDDRVRANHAALDGVRLPKDDPRWATITPPCGFNCRCTRLEIFHGDAEARTVAPRVKNIDGINAAPVPDEGWDFDPGQLFAAVVQAGA